MVNHSIHRVVHATTVHPATDNRIFRKECVGLAERGFEVHLIAPEASAGMLDGVRLWPVARAAGRLGRLGTQVQVWQRLRRLRPDLVHVHDPELIPLAALWRLRHRTAVVYDAHEDLPKQVLGKGYIPRPIRRVVAVVARALEAIADRSMTFVVAATPSIARNYRHAEVVLVQNFPWERDFPDVEGVSERSRLTFVYAGGISVDRGLVGMIEATDRLDGAAVLELAGRPMSEIDQQHLDSASERVVYRGVLDASEVPAFLHGAVAGLCVLPPLPNYLESQPTKTFEYLAAGLPVIASDFPAWRRLLDGTGAALWVRPGEPEELRSVMANLVEDRALAAEMGRRGREAFLTKFCFETQIEHLAAAVGAVSKQTRGMQST